MSVEKLWDELWIGVKCQSNPEIAGSPRNSFRASLECLVTEVEHWIGQGAQAYRTKPNSECRHSKARELDCVR